MMYFNRNCNGREQIDNFSLDSLELHYCQPKDSILFQNESHYQKEHNAPVFSRVPNNPVFPGDPNNLVFPGDSKNHVFPGDPKNYVFQRDTKNQVFQRGTNNPVYTRDPNNPVYARDPNTPVFMLGPQMLSSSSHDLSRTKPNQLSSETDVEYQYINFMKNREHMGDLSRIDVTSRNRNYEYLRNKLLCDRNNLIFSKYLNYYAKSAGKNTGNNVDFNYNERKPAPPLLPPPRSKTAESMQRKWGSEESILQSKCDSGFGKSDSDSKESDSRSQKDLDFREYLGQSSYDNRYNQIISPKHRKVCISNSTEILSESSQSVSRQSGSSIYSKPLKSALKYPTKTKIVSEKRSLKPTKPIRKNERVPNYSREPLCEIYEPQEEFYDPSLPYIPLDRNSKKSQNSKVTNENSKNKERASKRVEDLAAIYPASVDKWHEVLSGTSKLGWSLILYLAVRSHYKPEAFAKLLFEGNRDFVRAVADYVTREPTLLSFRKGDVIRVTNSDISYADKGWLHGILDGRTGMFPVEYVTPIGRTEARLSNKTESIDPGLLMEKRSPRDAPKSPDREVSPVMTSVGTEGISGTTWTVAKSPSSPQHEDSGHSSGGEVTEGSQKTSVDDGKHSLFQFALHHFRGAKESGVVDGSLQMAMQKAKKKKGSKEETHWTWKDLVELVKFSQSPLKVSLLDLEPDLSALAVETFTAIMRYMGDFPIDAQQTEVHCVYFILMNCHKHEALRDEVYCQVMKQTTNNKSSVPESCQRGWRLFSIIAAYFTCSEVLRPYLLKYLETNAYDKRRAFHGTAMVCLQNIRKTFKYGGRKNVPSIEEITAITAGRNSKRQIYRLPGGTERVINTKSTSVVQDILEELCALINVRSLHEQEEFSLYCIVEGDSFTMPLAREEYVLDVTTELLKNKQIFYLVFCRSVYYYPLRLDSGLYIEVVFNQIAPDYLAGFLLITPGEHLEQDVVYDVAKIAALMHRAADLDHVPTIKEVKYLLPRPLLKARDVKPPAWVSLVQGSWSEAMTLSSMEAKAAVLEILQKWPLFGSAFFDVQRLTEPEESVHTILALNKSGVHFLEPLTHESLFTYPLDKILSTRKVKGNDGELYLDMKCGNLMKPKIITLKTNQAHEISRQIRQYITTEQRFHDGPQDDNPRDVTLTR